MHVVTPPAQADPGRFVIEVPSTFDLDALSAIEPGLLSAPADAELVLDFGAVQVCHAFVFARLLARVVALGRPWPTRLLNLSTNQQRLLSGQGFPGFIAEARRD